MTIPAVSDSPGTTVTWLALDDTLTIGVDLTTGGVAAVRAGGSEFPCARASEIVVSVGGREIIDWRDVPGNNLVGDRSTVVADATTVSLAGEVIDYGTVTRGPYRGVTTRRVVHGLTITEEFVTAGDGVVSRTLELAWPTTWQGGPLRWVECVAPGVADSPGQTQMRGVGMAISPGWKHRTLGSSLSRDLMVEHGPSALVPLMADVGSAFVGVTDGVVTVWAGCAESRFAVSVDVVAIDGAWRPTHRIHASSLTEKEGALTLGPQVFSVGSSPGPVGKSIRRHLDDQAPRHMFTQQRPAEIASMTIYEVHMGNKFPDPFAPHHTDGPCPYPQVSDLIADVPRISSMGFNTIQLMPQFPYPGYTIDDYAEPENQYGGLEALTSLADACRRAGLRLVVDFILHGPVDQDIPAYRPWAPLSSRYLSEHPDWFMRAEDGRIRRTHTYSFDLAHPGVIDHMVQAMVRLVTLGVGGFRVDAPLWNYFPHWGDNLPYPAGHSTMGWVELVEAARQEINRLGHDCVFIGETAGFLGQHVFDLVYGYEEMGVLRSFVRVDATFLALGLFPDDRVSAADIRLWLGDKISILGPSATAQTIRHLDSHDSHEWGGLSTWARDVFGPAFAPLLACLATLPGPWMHFVGAEEGVEDVVRDIMIRRQHPSIAGGVLDLDATSSDHPDLLHFLSQQGDHVTLVVANLSPHPIDTSLWVDGDAAARLGVDALSSWVVDTDGGRLHVRLEPFAYRFFHTPDRAVERNDESCQ
jgi:glycosidase